ncbi:MAG: hypothetical protein JSV27_10790 [Candidatus Bathyarchaeota archaeon]|nr:MAG: hypothetical protein JSV27_10790 [Candidatus Bathyarchaeota archaeon]
MEKIFSMEYDTPEHRVLKRIYPVRGSNMRNRANKRRLKPLRLMFPTERAMDEVECDDGVTDPRYSWPKPFTIGPNGSRTRLCSSVQGALGNIQEPAGGFVYPTGNDDIWTSQNSLLIKMSAINRDNIEYLTSTIRRLNKAYSITDVRGESFLKINI